MHIRSGLLALAAFAGLTVSAFGQGTTLKWKFTPNTSFYQEMTTTTEQTMKVMGTDVKQTQSQTFYFKWTPVESTSEGGWKIKQQIVGVKMTIDIGGNKVEYDSTKEGQAGNNPLADFFKALVNSEFTMELDKDFNVKKIEGRDKFVKDLAKANPQMEPLLNQILSEKALMDMAQPTFSAVPNKDVKPGDTWTKETTLDMGPIGSYKTTFKYTYDGKNTAGADEAAKKLDKISVTTTLAYTAPKDPAAGNTLPFRIKKADLTSKDATGTILFDADKGRIASSDMKLTLTGTLDIEISGQTTQVTLTQTQTTKVTTTDEEPAALKKPK